MLQGNNQGVHCRLIHYIWGLKGHQKVPVGLVPPGSHWFWVAPKKFSCHVGSALLNDMKSTHSSLWNIRLIVPFFSLSKMFYNLVLPHWHWNFYALWILHDHILKTVFPSAKRSLLIWWLAQLKNNLEGGRDSITIFSLLTSQDLWGCWVASREFGEKTSIVVQVTGEGRGSSVKKKCQFLDLLWARSQRIFWRI